MNRVRPPRGGVLWDLFLILLVLSAAATAWVQRDRLRGLLPSATPLGRRSTAVAPSPERTHSAAFRAQVRGLLSRHGVRESDLRQSYTVERGEPGERWAEETLDITRPPSFRGDRFLKDLAPLLGEHRLSLLRDEPAMNEWTLELGESGRVYQRLRFWEATGTRSSKPSSRNKPR